MNEELDYESVVQWSYTLAKKWAVEFLVPEGVVSARKFEKYKRDGGHLPKHFPLRPYNYFKSRDTWKGWDDFLGNPDKLAKGAYVSWEEAKRLTRRAKIATSGEFKRWKKRPACIPAQPKFHYEEWKDWPDFLGDNYMLEGKVRNGKLKEKDVRIIKHQLKLGVPSVVLAKMFKVSDMQIFRIKSGENWGHVEV